MNYSKQREFILESVNTLDHPTAEAVYSYVKEKMPLVSLGTVYRNLNQLADKGIIQRIKISDGSDIFDHTLTPHGHFICAKCGKVIDIDYNDKHIKEFEKQNSLIVNNYSFELHGLCNQCIKKNNK